MEPQDLHRQEDAFNTKGRRCLLALYWTTPVWSVTTAVRPPASSHTGDLAGFVALGGSSQ